MNCHTKLSHSDSFSFGQPKPSASLWSHPKTTHPIHIPIPTPHLPPALQVPAPPGSRKGGVPMGWGPEGKDFLFAHSALIVWKINTSAVAQHEKCIWRCYWEILKLARLSERCQEGSMREGWGEELQRIPSEKTTISARQTMQELREERRIKGLEEAEQQQQQQQRQSGRKTSNHLQLPS